MYNSDKSKLALMLLLLIGLVGIGFGTAFAAPDAGPEISIQSDIPALSNSTVYIPVNFSANGHSISSLAFSIDYDQTWLNFDQSLPYSITFTLPAGTVGSCEVDITDTDGEIDCIVVDPMVPLLAIPDGTFLTLKLRTLNAPDGTTAPVNFSTDPAPSFGRTDGQSEPGTGVDGSVKFGKTSWFGYLPLLFKQTPIPTTVTPTPDTPTPDTPTPDTPTPGTPIPETPTPTPDCDNVILNGGFEDESDGENDGYGWELPVTAYTASFSDDKANSGVWSLFTGIFDINSNTYSWSSGYQIVSVPGAATDAVLTFWNYPRSGESTIQRLSANIWARIVGITPNTPLAFDMQYVAVEDLTAGTEADVLFWQMSNSREWEEVELDLIDYAGHTIRIWFTTYNDGYHGVSSMFVDDVSLEVCE